MAARGYGWEPPPHPAQELPSQQASLFDPPAQQTSWGTLPPPAQSPRPLKPPWYRQTWFVSLLIIVVFGTIGAFLGSRLG
jgi:hypothetical protein